MNGKMHATQDPLAHMEFAGQTFPQALQFCGSEFRSVHIPLQQAVPAGQQA
jgi:hypothetical protein